MEESKYYVYMLRCKDGSLYTGITKDVARRFKEHSTKCSKGAKYTRAHDAIKIEAVWELSSKSKAAKVEYRIKRLKKKDKEKMIEDNTKLEEYLKADYGLNL